MTLNNKLLTFIESKGHDVSDAVMYLLACRHELKHRCTEEVFQFLVENKFVRLNLLNNKVEVLIGLYEGEEVNLPEIDLSVEQVVRDRVDEYRSLFKGIRTGSIGEKQKVINMLSQFCLQNNKTFDEVITVTKVYMQYTDTQMISNADNFISKIDRNGDEISLIKMAFEEQGMGEDSGQRTYKVI
jgi:hypothetical protein